MSLIQGFTLHRELSSHDPRAELGYRLIISVDATDPSQPLGITHQPALHGDETSVASKGLRINQLESFLIQTVHLRSKHRLTDLQKELELSLSLSCTLEGVPPVLIIPILGSCTR